MVSDVPCLQLEVDTKSFVRIFDANVDPQELVWHRDHHSRTITVLQGKNWQFQFDNCLPQTLVPGQQLMVAADAWHRLIAGSDNLVLAITES